MPLTIKTESAIDPISLNDNRKERYLISQFWVRGKSKKELQVIYNTETKETLKKAKIRAAEQLRKDTLAQYSRRSRSSINNRIQ